MTSPSEDLLESNAIDQFDRIHQLQSLRMARLQEEAPSQSNNPTHLWELMMGGMVTGATIFVAGMAFANYYLPMYAQQLRYSIELLGTP